MLYFRSIHKMLELMEWKPRGDSLTMELMEWKLFT